MASTVRPKGKVLILSAEERAVTLRALRIYQMLLEKSTDPHLSRSAATHGPYLRTLINRLGYTEADLGHED